MGIRRSVRETRGGGEGIPVEIRCEGVSTKLRKGLSITPAVMR